METEQAREFIKLMQTLDEKGQTGIYLMSEGLRMMAENKKAAAKKQRN